MPFPTFVIPMSRSEFGSRLVVHCILCVLHQSHCGKHGTRLNIAPSVSQSLPYRRCNHVEPSTAHGPGRAGEYGAMVRNIGISQRFGGNNKTKTGST